MSRHIAKALAAVALACLGGSAVAGDPPVSLLPQGAPAAGGTVQTAPVYTGPVHAAPVYTGASCAPCTVNCGGCGPERGGFYGSVGVLFLKQDGSRDLAWSSQLFSEVDPTTGATELLSTGRDEFYHDHDLSGRLELGWKGSSGLGGRFRYFFIRNSSAVSLLDDSGSSVGPPPFDFVAFNQNTGLVITPATPLGVGITSVGTADSPSTVSMSRDIKLQSWDLDLTADCKYGCNLDVTYSAGLRWLHISQGFNAADVVNDPATIGLPDVIPAVQAISSRHSLNGFGPTIGVEGRYGVSGGLKGVGSARFGLLYAEGSQTVTGGEIPSDAALNYLPIQALQFGATGERRGIVPTGEVELGAEYGRILGCNGPELYLRATMLGQVYWNAGTSARVNFNSNAANEDLIFHGYSLSVGIRY